jgi:hypothetical protein
MKFWERIGQFDKEFEIFESQELEEGKCPNTGSKFGDNEGRQCED